jgi:hypothetical protein
VFQQNREPYKWYTTFDPGKTFDTQALAQACEDGKRRQIKEYELKDIDNQEWQTLYKEKLNECVAVLETFVARFEELDPQAILRIRGSLAHGISQLYLGKEGARLFNPSYFDIDAYVMSDSLYEKAIRTPRGAANVREGQVSGRCLASVNAIIRDMQAALSEIKGMRDYGQSAWRFNVLIRTSANADRTTKRDEKLMRELWEDDEHWDEEYWLNQALPIRISRPKGVHV